MKTLLIACVLWTILMLGCQSNNIPQQVSANQESVIEPKPTPQPAISTRIKPTSDIKIYWGQTRCQAEIKPGILTISNDKGLVDQLDATKRAILVIRENERNGEPGWSIIFIEMNRQKNRPENLKLYWVNKKFLLTIIDIGGFKHAVLKKKIPKQEKTPPTRRVPRETRRA